MAMQSPAAAVASPAMARPQETPPLAPGDHLSRAEFERRYAAHPDIKKAELIEGVVFMPSPVRFDRHAAPHLALAAWAGVYLASTPGVHAGDNATVRLDNQNEPQPDLLLRIDAAHGGRSTVAPDDYIEGAPELVVEVAATGMTPRGPVDVVECSITSDLDGNGCELDRAQHLVAGDDGSLGTTYAVNDRLDTASGPVDCRTGGCILVAVDRSVPIAFGRGYVFATLSFGDPFAPVADPRPVPPAFTG